MPNLPAHELENLRAKLRPQDRHRLRPDGMVEPELPPLHLCGGLEAPYVLSDYELSRSSNKPAQQSAPSP